MRHLKDYHQSKSRKEKNMWISRANQKYVEAVHFNNNGKRNCSVFVVDPRHTTSKEDVTCCHCLSNINKAERK